MPDSTILSTPGDLKHVKKYELIDSTAPALNPSYKGVHGNYKILGKIDGGKFSSVYKARHRHNNDIVALKRLKSKEMKYQLPDAWRQEIEIHSQLIHPHITKFIDVTMSEKTKSICLVLEYVNYSFWDVFGVAAFSDEQIRFVMQQLLLAVKYLHANDVIHRDLKPENLLFSEDGMLKVADFGQSIRNSSTIIKRDHGDYFGTQYYKGIEILLGSKTFTNAVDIWAVGCIFAELFKGDYLFQSGCDRKLVKCIFKICGTPTEKTWPGVSELPGMEAFKFSIRHREKLRKYIDRPVTDSAFHLLKKMLAYCPASRISAKKALKCEYFALSKNEYDCYEMAQWLSRLKLSKQSK